jgi:hypothetical protein
MSTFLPIEAAWAKVIFYDKTRLPDAQITKNNVKNGVKNKP